MDPCRASLPRFVLIAVVCCVAGIPKVARILAAIEVSGGLWFAVCAGSFLFSVMTFGVE